MTTGFVRAPGARFPHIEMAPNASSVYDLDWADSADTWLLPGDTLTSVQHTVAPPGLGISDQVHTASRTQVRLTAVGAAVGQTYLVTCWITTSMGNPDSRSFEVRVVVR